MKWFLNFCLVNMFTMGVAAAEPQSTADAGSGELLVIVNEKGNPKLSKISVGTLRKVLTCQITKWSDVPGSSRTDNIKVYVQDDIADATRLLKARVGEIQFGSCVSTIVGRRMDQMIARGLGSAPPNAKAKEVVQGIGYLVSGPKMQGTRVLQIVDDKKKASARLGKGHEVRR